MKKLSAAVLLCSLFATAPAFAGEDSTERWDAAGTGPTFWESPCSLAEFQGNVPLPEKCRPVRASIKRDRPAPTLNDSFHYPSSN